jgi:hypothetical protein
VPDPGPARTPRPTVPPVEKSDTIEGCETKPTENGLLLSCVADRFALELPGLSDGFVWSLRRPTEPRQSHVIFVAEDARKNAELYSLSVLVGPDYDEGRNVSSQLAALYDRLRRDTLESGKADPQLGRDLTPARPCETKNHLTCLAYQVKGMSIDGKSVVSTHAWTALQREDGSTLFFHAAWAGYASQRNDPQRLLNKVDRQMRSLLDASYVTDASGRRITP